MPPHPDKKKVNICKCIINPSQRQHWIANLLYVCFCAQIKKHFTAEIKHAEKLQPFEGKERRLFHNSALSLPCKVLDSLSTLPLQSTARACFSNTVLYNLLLNSTLYLFPTICCQTEVSSPINSFATTIIFKKKFFDGGPRLYTSKNFLRWCTPSLSQTSTQRCHLSRMHICKKRKLRECGLPQIKGEVRSSTSRRAISGSFTASSAILL